MEEKKQICLNYAANVPEWQLALTLDALARLGDVSRYCGTVQKAVAGDLAWMKLHPDSEYIGTLPIDRVKACQEAARALGGALYALEIVLAQADSFSFAKDLAGGADATYNGAHVTLEEMCRKHGCSEAAYKHGQNEHL